MSEEMLDEGWVARWWPREADRGVPAHVAHLTEIRRLLLVLGLSGLGVRTRRNMAAVAFRFAVMTDPGAKDPAGVFTAGAVEGFCESALAGVALTSRRLVRRQLLAFVEAQQAPGSSDRSSDQPLAGVSDGSLCGAMSAAAAATASTTTKSPQPLVSPADVVELVGAWVPSELSPKRWEAVEVLTRKWVLASVPHRGEVAVLRLRLTSLLLAQAAHRGQPLDVSVFADGPVGRLLDAFGLTPKTRTSYRSQLNQVARAAGGLPPVARQRQVYRHNRLTAEGGSAPYSNREIRALLKVAASMPDKRSRRSCRALILLGAGAGVVGGWAAGGVKVTDVLVRDNTVLVRVRDADGKIVRTVPVDNHWAAMLLDAAEVQKAAGERFLLGGVGASRMHRPATVLAAFTNRSYVCSGTRLRNHWLVNVFNGQVPLLDAIEAAGFVGVDGLTPILPFLTRSTRAQQAFVLSNVRSIGRRT